jgi:hypothetical protein
MNNSGEKSSLRAAFPFSGTCFALFCIALFASCSVAKSVRRGFGGEIPFTVTVAPDANENSAVAVDVVVVYDPIALDQLMKLPARKWFADKKQFENDHRGQIDVQSWEWAPSQSVGEQSVAYHSGARKIVVFADYLREGDHRAALDPQQPFHLTLDTLNLDVRPQ